MDIYNLRRQSYSSKWNSIYSKKDILPWVNSELPLEALKIYSSLLSPQSKILDFGCGTGRIAAFLDNLGFEILAADCSKIALEKALPLKRGKYVRSENLEDFEHLEIDGLVLWGILHHYPPKEWPEWLRKASMCVKRGGIVMIGLFDDCDTKFQSQMYRTSSTTEDSCWSAIAVEFFNLAQNSFEKIYYNAKIILHDGGESSRSRTWLCCICKTGNHHER